MLEEPDIANPGIYVDIVVFLTAELAVEGCLYISICRWMRTVTSPTLPSSEEDGSVGAAKWHGAVRAHTFCTTSNKWTLIWLIVLKLTGKRYAVYAAILFVLRMWAKRKNCENELPVPVRPLYMQTSRSRGWCWVIIISYPVQVLVIMKVRMHWVKVNQVYSARRTSDSNPSETESQAQEHTQ